MIALLSTVARIILALIDALNNRSANEREKRKAIAHETARRLDVGDYAGAYNMLVHGV